MGKVLPFSIKAERESSEVGRQLSERVVSEIFDRKGCMSPKFWVEVISQMASDCVGYMNRSMGKEAAEIVISVLRNLLDDLEKELKEEESR